MRLDKFLKVSGIVKRRTVSQDLIDLGGVSKDGRILKPSYEVKIGDILTIHMRDETFTIKIIDIPQKNEKGNYFEVYSKNGT